MKRILKQRKLYDKNNEIKMTMITVSILKICQNEEFSYLFWN